MINTRFRSDPRVLDLDPSEKLLYMYLITNEKTDLCGIYEIHTRTVAFQTGFEKDMIEKMLERFVKDGKIKRHNNYIYIMNFAKNQVDNPSISK